ncbi:MAG TPA: DUF3105 domain-containing protein [Actinomycetota bacterium]|jgi:Protein of unknown function (DUF3105)
MVDQQKPDKASGRPQSKGSGGQARRQPGGQPRKQQGGQPGRQQGGQPGRQRPATGKARQGAPGKSKLAKGAAARRQAERRRRQRTFAWTAGVIVLVVALVGVIAWQGRDRSTKLTQPSAAALARATSAAGCGQVQQFKEAGRTHITADQQPKNWNSQPPTSGDHLATPLPPRVYQDQQDERALVHNLEHGYVVVQYKNLPQKQVDLLTGIGDGLKGRKFVLAPYDGLPSDGVALTAWRNLQTCKQANVDVVSAFANAYMLPGGDKSVAPEPNAP